MAEREETPVSVKFVLTLMANGFVLDTVNSHPGYALHFAHRTDEFGGVHQYAFVLTDGQLEAPAAEAISRLASERRAQVVVVGHGGHGLLTLSIDEFLAKLGGAVPVWLPLEEGFKDHLVTLGHNNLPDGLQGRADDLFEEYVHVAIQFLFADKVVRYGQDRRFEKVPDGLAMRTGRPVALYDAKAAKDGYDVTTDSIRQFCSYVREFDRRWEAYAGKTQVFVVISGHFVQDGAALQNRSDEAYADCGVKLCFVESDQLGDIVRHVARDPRYRHGLDWPRLFSRTELRATDVETALIAARKDGVTS